MNEENVQLLRTTFARFAQDGEKSAELFYERLFVLDPALRRLFAETDLYEQRMKLMAALGMAVNSLERFETIQPLLETLAKRHVSYGVREDHYRTVGQALLQSLALCLGRDFTPEARRAWTDAYEAISAVMMTAVRRVFEAAPAE